MKINKSMIIYFGLSEYIRDFSRKDISYSTNKGLIDDAE